MRSLIMGAAVILLAAAPSYAQAERGYVAAAGGFAVTPDTPSGNVLGEAGVRIAPHLTVFGTLGQYHNLQPSTLQPTVDSADTQLASTDGLDVVGTARVPAWYSVGGLRFDAPIHARLSPYVLGGVGFARLTPT